MYRRIEDFIVDWKAEEQFTLKVFDAVTEEVKAHRSNDDIRSLERLAWHITQTLTEMPSKSGIIDADVLENVPIPSHFSEIIETYKLHSSQLQSLLQERWTDEGLTETISVYGQQWERRKILSVLIKHQIHHRAQMTTLMRIQNIPTPSTYGPSKEEWSKFGMEPHE